MCRGASNVPAMQFLADYLYRGESHHLQQRILGIIEDGNSRCVS